jgi:formate hydrogenlyase subunit 6/NADH:ubiquinone oxidoreductase subunit I
MIKQNSTYRTHLTTVLHALLAALMLAWKHFRSAVFRRKNMSIEDPSYFTQQDGIVTTLYPHEAIPVPDNGRYRLHNEMEDCIVCDLCAKICPVNCIDIDPIKSTVEIGKTSDGSTRRIYAATFDIDMAKCCYCGLCTTVCPTESLTMTKAYDYSEFDIKNMVYKFGDLSPEEAVLKRKEWDEAQLAKQAAKAVASDPVAPASSASSEVKPSTPKPFIPKTVPPKVVLPTTKISEEANPSSEVKPESINPKVVMPPKIKIPPMKKKDEGDHSSADQGGQV